MALTSEQRRNAQIIVNVGASLGASRRDLLIALMTAMQESGLRNLTWGHLDSVGLFQQRNAWGSFGQRTNPAQSARMFFLGGNAGQRGLFDFRNRGQMSLTQAAQAVQVSAFPNAYAKHEGVARQLLGMSAAGPGGGGGGAGVRTGTTSSFVRPVSGGRITQRFGDPAPRGVTYAGGTKNGISIAAAYGSPVYAAGRGRVVRVASAGAYGNRVEIEHGGRRWTLYAHMSTTNVRVGQQVEAGQIIGRIGATGQATGPHLHFEVREGSNRYGSAVDPMRYLNMNTTPSAYIQDTYQVLDITVPGMAEPGPWDPMDQVMQKPYIYLNPFAQLQEDTEIIPESADPFGGLLDSTDQQEFSFSLDVENQDMTEVPEPEAVL